MNLGIDISFLNTLEQKQGVHRYAIGLINELSNLENLKIQLYTNNKVYNDARKKFSSKNIQIYKIKNKYFFFKRIFEYFLFCFGLINVYFFKLHYVIINFFNRSNKDLIESKSDIILFLNSQEIAYNFRIKTIINFHDLLHKKFPDFLSKKELVSREYSYHNSAKSADYLIASSLFMKKEFLNFYKFIKKDQVLIMREGIDKKLFNYKDASNGRKIKFKNFLFYPAQLWKHKNHILLLKAFKEVSKKNKELMLILCGSKKNNYTEVMEFIKKNNLIQKVKYLGNISQANLLYCYKKSLLVILPSLYESSSLVALESIKMKKPIICSNIGPMTELKNEFKFIYFNAHSYTSLIHSIKFALKNKNKLRKYSLQNLNNLDNFSWNRTTEVLKKKLINLEKSLTKN
tara:strand:+ start:114 stop:1319 length:1206 start_codon:yes stop_codon:yes gene_type:complete